MADENEIVELDEEVENAEALDEFMEEQRKAAEAMRLPQAPIDRIIKEMLPSGMHASKETRAIFSRAVSVFIICLGTAAHDSALSAKRKGILEKDVFSALKKMHLNIPEIATLLDNFKANMERQKQAKAADSSKLDETDADEATADDTNVAEISNVDENMQVDEVMGDSVSDSLSTLPR